MNEISSSEVKVAFPEKSYAARRNGKRLLCSGTTPTRVIFGPFVPHEIVSDLVLTTYCSDAVTFENAWTIDVRMFAVPPVDQTTFEAHGVAIYDALNLPRLKAMGFMYTLPVNWVADDKFRFLGLQVTSDAAAHDSDGGVYFRLCPASIGGY